MRGRQVEDRIQFTGLTSHNNAEMSDRAASIAGLDSDEAAEQSLTTAIRELETADDSPLAWKVPESVAPGMDSAEFNENAPDGTEAYQVDDSTIFVETDRFQSVISPNKLEQYLDGEYENDDDVFLDALWHVPTKDYSIVNPLDAWEPLEQAIREEELGDEVFGEIRTRKGGGEVHMDVLFDNYQIEYTDDEDGSDPIILGIRTGYDFFGGTALYFEGYAQDTRCDNSIRSITDEKVFRHVGEHDLEDEVADILGELGVIQNRLADLIEMAQGIELDLVEQDYAEPFDHTDDLQAFYELAGFPSYLAEAAARHARSRADNRFMPSMTAVWDGGTYAMTHHYNGGENTSRANELIDISNDFIYNPSLALGEVESEHSRRLASSSSDSDDDTDVAGEQAHAVIEEFSQSIREQAEEFESRNEELRQTLIAEAPGGDGEAEADA